MKTKSLNTLLKHKFFLYGMIALSILQLVNFYRARSFSCLGTFGVAYYLGCMLTRNKALCLLFAILVSTVVMGCEGRFVTFMEGMEPNDPCTAVQGDDLNDNTVCEGVMSSDNQNACVYTAAVGNEGEEGYTAASCAAPQPAAPQCGSYTTEADCASPCSWDSATSQCNDPTPSPI